MKNTVTVIWSNDPNKKPVRLAKVDSKTREIVKEYGKSKDGKLKSK